MQGTCNSKVMKTIALLMSPTLNFEINQVKDYPVIEDKSKKAMVNIFLIIMYILIANNKKGSSKTT